MLAGAETATCWILSRRYGKPLRNEPVALGQSVSPGGGLTTAGYPRHPLRAAYSEEPVEFDIGSYLKKLGY